MSNDNKNGKVVILGAGPAGCAAGYDLTKHNADVVLIERLSQVGGLSRTINRGNAKYDIGPHRFFTTSAKVRALWDEVGGKSLKVVPRMTRILFNNHLFNYPLQPLNAFMGLGVLRSLAAITSYTKSKARVAYAPRTPQNFEEWVIDQFGNTLYRTFFKTYTEKVWGIPCSDISTKWASQRIKGLNLSQAIINALRKTSGSGIKTLIDHFIYPSDGCGSIYEKQAEIILQKKGRLLKNTEVVAVRHDGAGRITGVDLATAEGISAIGGDYFISTIPLTDLVKAMRPLPQSHVLKAADQLKYRTHISVNLLVAGKLFTDNWIYVHSPSVKVGRIANYRNFSNMMHHDADITPLTFEYFVFDNDAIDSLTDNALIELAVTEGSACKLLPGGVEKILDAFVVRNKQAYCVMSKGFEAAQNILREYTASFSNLQVAGRAGMFKYNNQDHSIMTGLLAAENALGGKHDVWSVNIDAAYQESGAAPNLCDADREEMKV